MEGTRVPEIGINHSSDYFVDWSPTRGVAYAIDDQPPRWHTGAQPRDALLDFIRTRPPGSTVYLETNFEAHDPERHNHVVDEAITCSVKLRVLPLRVTGRYKSRIDFATGNRDAKNDDKAELTRKLGLHWLQEVGLSANDVPNGEKADDLRAVIAIRLAVRLGQHTSAPRRSTRTPTEIERFKAYRTSHLLIRDDPWVLELTSDIPYWVKLHEARPDEALFLGDGVKTTKGHRLSGYSLELVCGALVAARSVDNRREFDRVMGLYAHGYPSVFRSSYIRRVDTLTRREHRGVELFFEPNRDAPIRLTHRHYRTIARRAARLVWHLTCEEGMNNSATDIRYSSSQLVS